MEWLGDSSHRGRGCQAWTAVGLPPRYPPHLVQYTHQVTGYATGNSSSWRTYVYWSCLFISPRDLRAPSADRRKTLPRDQYLGLLYSTSPKIRLNHKPACRLPVNYTHHRHFITQPESWYSFYHPTEGRRLSRPSWLATYQDGLPARKWSPIQVLTGPGVEKLRWSRPTRYR